MCSLLHILVEGKLPVAEAMLAIISLIIASVEVTLILTITITLVAIVSVLVLVLARIEVWV